MPNKQNIFAIIGSASENSSNEKLINIFKDLTSKRSNVTIFNDLKTLPHFSPELSIENTPQIISDFRNQIEKANGIIICTPEYVFSIPSGLKNALEWCVSATVFTNKPIGLITASASGVKGHEELLLIMQTLMAKFNTETTLLISGIKGKINQKGEITDQKTKNDFDLFIEGFETLIV